jgi:hypothetical protein
VSDHLSTHSILAFQNLINRSKVNKYPEVHKQIVYAYGTNFCSTQTMPLRNKENISKISFRKGFVQIEILFMGKMKIIILYVGVNVET